MPAPLPRSTSRPLTWDFPLPRTHTGVVLGNGVQGLMVWGDEHLQITVGRAGFWDHRGGNRFAARTTYAEVRRLLEAGDEPGLMAVFARPDRRPGYPDRPTQVGCGRIEVAVPGWRPRRAALDPASAILRVTFTNAAGHEAAAVIRQAMDAELAWIEFDPALAEARVAALPTWRWVGEQLAEVGVAPPQEWQRADGGGFCQTLPEDAPLALAWRREGMRLIIASALGAVEETTSALIARADLATRGDIAAAARRATAWWADYARDVPDLDLPDATLQQVWDYGVYKQAGLTTPGGVAATLQGPWLEEYQLPPWSCDYHFNINVQMIYWPCLATNRLAHLQPLWDLIRGWMPLLRTNAEHFFAAKDALMLPHAVDDRCAAVGAFWTGMIDHACTAWMAQLAWLHYRHGLDPAVLRDTAWPLLTGAFNGYWAMIEEVDGRLALPVTVSPEFKGARFDAWGRDASFQLAACHAVAAILPQAAAALGVAVDPRWARVTRDLPPYTTITAPAQRECPERVSTRIALWQDMDLIESHRHHSHLGAIYPFCTVDPQDPAHAQVVADSIAWWTRQGPGGWSGWCVPWAAILNARCDRADGALAWLHWWKDVFTNVGHGTLHDADFQGASTIYAGRSDEIMQCDAAMGALNAIQELLVQVRAEVITVLPAIPRAWRRLRFDGILCEGAFLVGATVAEGRTVEVRVESRAGGPLRLRHGITGPVTVDGVAGGSAVIERVLRAGERMVVRAG